MRHSVSRTLSDEHWLVVLVLGVCVLHMLGLILILFFY